MAQRIQVLMVDDMEGQVGEDVQTLTFGLDGVSYEIDLNGKNQAKIRKALEPFAEKARRVGGRKATASGAKRPNRSTSNDYNNEIREWARANGHEVAERGRLKREIVEAYEKANPTAVPA